MSNNYLVASNSTTHIAESIPRLVPPETSVPSETLIPLSSIFATLAMPLLIL